MAKKKKKKQKGDEKIEHPREPQPVGLVNDDTAERQMDFGGLPDRDLKKNLGGCG